MKFQCAAGFFGGLVLALASFSSQPSSSSEKERIKLSARGEHMEGRLAPSVSLNFGLDVQVTGNLEIQEFPVDSRSMAVEKVECEHFLNLQWVW